MGHTALRAINKFLVQQARTRMTGHVRAYILGFLPFIGCRPCQMPCDEAQPDDISSEEEDEGKIELQLERHGMKIKWPRFCCGLARTLLVRAAIPIDYALVDNISDIVVPAVGDSDTGCSRSVCVPPQLFEAISKASSWVAVVCAYGQFYVGTDPLWTISDSIKCIILIGQIIFNFLQLQIPGREVPSNRIIHWGLMAALPLYFFNMLGANAPFYAGWQAFIVLNTMTLNIIAICGLYVVFNTIRVNYMTARLMKRIPTNLNMYFYSSAGIAVVMNTSAMVIILCIDRQSIDCMRFLALLTCVLFGGAALTYNWSVLRISIKRVFSNFFDEGNNNHGENEIKYEKQDATITSSDYMRLKDPQIISGRGHRHARSSVKDLVVSKGTISKDVSTASILQQDEHPSSPTPMTPKSPSSSTDIVADPTNATSGTRAPTTMGTKKPTHRYYASDVSVDFAVMKNGEAMETELKVVRESKSSAASEGIRKGSRRSMLHSVKRARSRSRSYLALFVPLRARFPLPHSKGGIIMR
eukprot:jgi/Bigna1/71962/fgenesh1_pg.17_\